MKFPWNKYEELSVQKRKTIQIFITNDCNLRCDGCFARNIIDGDKSNMSLDEYKSIVTQAVLKGARRITLIGGEPLKHPEIREMIKFNNSLPMVGIKTTIYTNGYYLDDYTEEDLGGATLRISLYCKSGSVKSAEHLPKTDFPIDICFMVSSTTTAEEVVETANYIEDNFKCKVFFISSLRELENPNQEFFEDTELTMPVMEYKQLVHNFLDLYTGNMEIHISKRGVFESTMNLPVHKCNFSNYFIGGKIIQCPFDIVNKKFQKDYEFGTRDCQHNSTCLMSKINVVKKKITII